MSEPAVFVLIRDGAKRFYVDRWAGVFLFREIFWGPEAFEDWVSQRDQIDEWTDDVVGGVVVDFDQRRLIWTGDDGQLNIPKVASTYDRLLRTAWPDYDIQRATTGLPELAKAAGVPHADEYDSQINTRYESVQAALGYSGEGDADDDEENEVDESGGGFDDQPRAWVTIIDAKGAVRHRQLEQLTEDLLGAADGAIDAAIRLVDAQIPPEALVTEGMWIDQSKRQIGLWGGVQTRHVLPQVEAAWRGWSVRWAERGYAEQCQVSGPPGIPMSNTEALAQFLPTILSTKRFDLGNVIGAVGSHIKRTAIKATGCFLGVICFPVVLFGLISGNWQAALITIAVVCVLVMIVFKVVEYRFKKKFAATMKPLDQDESGDQEWAPVAGPLAEPDRRRRVDQMLKSAGFPALERIEPSFPKDNPLDVLD